MLLAACSGSGAPPPAHSPSAATSAPADVQTEPVLVLDGPDRASARQSAVAVMRAYARPGASPARWWARLAPYLSPEARTAYEGTEPSRIPARLVTGPATLTSSSLPALARVSVPTDVGAYLVILSRTPATSWQIERLIPPEVL